MTRASRAPSVWRRMRRSAAAVGCSAALAIAGFGVVGAGSAAAAPAAGTAPAGSVECAQQSANAQFVRWIYLQILYRCPDDGGLAFWTVALTNGSWSRYAFVHWVDMSTENLVGNNIIPDYENVLNREPTQDEINEWLPKMTAEQGDADIIATLASSDEFWNSLTDSEACEPPAVSARGQGSISTDTSPPPDFTKVDCWLDMLYENVLDRSADQGGVQFYESILGPNPTRAQRYNVAYNYFEVSQENARGWVVAVYYAAFNRPPDSVGGEFWYHWLLNNNFMTFNMWQQFLASDESYGIAQQQLNPPAPAAKRSDRLAGARKVHHA